MDKLQKDFDRGERAKRLLADDMVKEARDHIDAELWRMFRETAPQDVKTLEFVKAMQYMHVKYFAWFERAVTDGKLAAINIEARKKTLKERVFG